jgi:hypothetical protein
MRRLDVRDWITAKGNCWAAHDRITELRHYALISRRQEKLLVKRDAFERKAAKLVEYPRPLSN